MPRAENRGTAVYTARIHQPKMKTETEIKADRLKAYRAVLEEFSIDPAEGTHTGAEDAAERIEGHESGEEPLNRYCVVKFSGDLSYSYPNYDNLEEAKAFATEDTADTLFAESPVAIIDLDTGERIVPQWESLQWGPETA